MFLPLIRIDPSEVGQSHDRGLVSRDKSMEVVDFRLDSNFRQLASPFCFGLISFFGGVWEEADNLVLEEGQRQYRQCALREA